MGVGIVVEGSVWVGVGVGMWVVWGLGWTMRGAPRVGREGVRKAAGVSVLWGDIVACAESRRRSEGWAWEGVGDQCRFGRQPTS